MAREREERMRYFLVEFDRLKNQGAWTDFETADAAMCELSRREAERTPEVEVVLLMAHSLQELKKTHGRYFQAAIGLADELLLASR